MGFGLTLVVVLPVLLPLALALASRLVPRLFYDDSLLVGDLGDQNYSPLHQQCLSFAVG